jgi:glycosyltransferase involved in cell wall biosynthesis
MTRVTIALLIPAYNASSHLTRLLQSAVRQTIRFDEIWVYDDCSTDGTATVARSFGARVVRGDVNRGCSHGKNVLARATSAEWVHFHDSDDELGPNFVQLARSWMEADEFDVVLFPYEERDAETGQRIGVRTFDPTDLMRDPRSYAIREQINPFCGLYRRASFLRAGGWDEDPLVLFNEDVAGHIRLAFAGLSFAAETEVSIINHRHCDSMSARNQLRCLHAQYHVMRRTVERDIGNNYGSEIARRLWAFSAGLATYLDWSTADACASLAMRLAGPSVAPAGRQFKALCAVSPRLALRIREFLIRALKPRYRDGFPGWRAPYSIL